jgi:4'-phosphopantetheinyl transferase EntD
MAAVTQELFPPCVAIVEATHETWDVPLRAAEEQYVRTAVEKRRREFRAGRACARAALRELGLAPGAIPVGPDRAPVWPEGVVGSITHTRDFCAAAAARREDLAGLGIDAEQRGSVGPELVRKICTTAEVRWMEESPPPEGATTGEWRTLVFSAKECLYKALHPSLGGAFLDFQNATLPCRPHQGAFWIEVATERRPPGVPALLEGRFLFTSHHVITGLAFASTAG